MVTLLQSSHSVSAFFSSFCAYGTHIFRSLLVTARHSKGVNILFSFLFDFIVIVNSRDFRFVFRNSSKSFRFCRLCGKLSAKVKFEKSGWKHGQSILKNTKQVSHRILKNTKQVTSKVPVKCFKERGSLRRMTLRRKSNLVTSSKLFLT